ncbi:MAG: hypothetical protein HY661_14645 [Betaproteobacteria bacterium]|nr:hypothetical protein [Betaproteobacteria bacterium]
MKRKFSIIAVTVLSTIAFSQLSNASVVVNPEDSGYLGPVALDNGYRGQAATAPNTASFSMFAAIVNPEDSGYLGPVALDNGYRGQAATAPSTASVSRFGAIVNPEDAGYRGPVPL